MDCDCLNYCGDDPRISTGEVLACESYSESIARRFEKRDLKNVVDGLCKKANSSRNKKVTLTLEQIYLIRKYL